MNKEDVLAIFDKTNARLMGHFELRSGLHSGEFFQCAHVLKHPNYAEELCRAAVGVMQDTDSSIEATCVISPAMGGLPVGHEVARALGVRHIFAEKEKDRLVMRRGFRIEPGERVVVAEDVVTRGGRVQETIDIVEGQGGVVAAVVVLVDRSAGKASFNAPFFSLIQMTPTVWSPNECPLCKKGTPIEHPGS